MCVLLAALYFFFFKEADSIFRVGSRSGFAGMFLLLLRHLLRHLLLLLRRFDFLPAPSSSSSATASSLGRSLVVFFLRFVEEGGGKKKKNKNRNKMASCGVELSRFFFCFSPFIYLFIFRATLTHFVFGVCGRFAMPRTPAAAFLFFFFSFLFFFLIGFLHRFFSFILETLTFTLGRLKKNNKKKE